jgi:hypothetical protein
MNQVEPELRPLLDRAAGGTLATASECRRTAVGAAMALLAVPRDASWLLFGTGPFVTPDGAPFTNLTILEPNAAALDHARSGVSRSAPGAVFRVIESRGVAMPTARPHDAILLGETLTYLDAPETWLAALAPRLVPGGRLAVLVDFYAENTAVHPWRRAHGATALHSALGWKRIFERAGFGDVAQQRIRLDGGEAWRTSQGSLLTSAAVTPH